MLKKSPPPSTEGRPSEPRRSLDMPEPTNFDEDYPCQRLKPRAYQRRWIEKTNKDRAAGLSRLLLDAVGGSGKTTYAGALALAEWNERSGRTLILENRIQLVEQTAKRIRDETGLEVDIEMGGQRASPFAHVVVATTPSLGRIPRLTSFPSNHFALVFADEAHNSTANLFLRIMRYFHFGEESLAEGWVQPKDGEYTPKCCVIGITATPDPHGNRNLGNFYQKFTDRYSYLEAIEDGWLVAPIEHNIPVRIDTSKFRRRATNFGMDFSPEDESAAIFPVIDALADQVVLLAKNRKTMCYLPSKECVMAMAEALNKRGLKALYVLGDCLDRNEKTDEFYNHGPGVCLCLCAMYVEGTDFPTVDTVAWFRPTQSPSFYKQGIYRMSRVLPGVVNDEMTAEERRAAIAASAKPYGMIIAPFYPSDSIDIMRAVDLFVDPSLKAGMRKAPTNLTDPDKIRDFIKSLEKAADKHAHKQPRTVNPLALAMSLRIGAYEAQNAADAAPPSREELDVLLGFGVSTVDVKSSGEAQRLISTLRERERLQLASPGQLNFLIRLGIPEESAVLMRAGQAGAIIGKRKAEWRR